MKLKYNLSPIKFYEQTNYKISVREILFFIRRVKDVENGVQKKTSKCSKRD